MTTLYKENTTVNDIIKIIPTRFAGTEVNSVNARDLWAFLESKQEFANWIKARIEKYSFIEGTDFIVLENPVKAESLGNPAANKVDYIITISMAKDSTPARPARPTFSGLPRICPRISESGTRVHSRAEVPHEFLILATRRDSRPEVPHEFLDSHNSTCNSDSPPPWRYKA